MSVNDSAGSRTDSVVVLSPQQFHARVVTALRAAMAARCGEAGDVGEDGMQALADLLQEVPALAPRSSDPFEAPMLVGAVRRMIDRRGAEAAASSEQLLADLLELVLAFYPEAMPPPTLSEQL